APVSREQPVQTVSSAVDADPPDSMRAWGFLTSPPQAPQPTPVTKTVPVPGSTKRPSDQPPSERSWGSPVREDGRAITGLMRRPDADPSAQLPPLVMLVKHGEQEDGPLCHMLRAAGYGVMLRQDASAGF